MKTINKNRKNAITITAVHQRNHATPLHFLYDVEIEDTKDMIRTKVLYVTQETIDEIDLKNETEVVEMVKSILYDKEEEIE